LIALSPAPREEHAARGAHSLLAHACIAMRRAVSQRALRQRENGSKCACKKRTRQSEKSDFSLGNAFFLQ